MTAARSRWLSSQLSPCSRSDVHRRKIGAHRRRVASAVDRVALTELSLVVSSPALDRVVGEERAGVVALRRYARDDGSRTEIDCGEVRSHLRRARADVRSGRRDAELTELVLAPAFHAPCREERTREVAARRD